MLFKLANIVLSADDFLVGNEDLVMRLGGSRDVLLRALKEPPLNKLSAEERRAHVQRQRLRASGEVSASAAGEGAPASSCFYDDEQGVLEFSGTVDFLTYFNALPMAKWLQYASLDNVVLHLELSGSDCDIVLQRVYAPAYAAGKPHAEWREPINFYEQDGWQSFDIPVDLDNAVLVGLFLASAGTTRMRNAYFATDVDEDRIRPVRIALSTTTFNNEDYILPNIDLVRTHILESDEAFADAFHLFVVDNGRTLEADALSSDGVTVIPNRNVGGAGGFARGMLAALDWEGEAFTHVLLMDDDVRVSPESFIRTYALLALANERYADAFVQGAMLKLQEPNMQFEDVSFVRYLGGYEAYKPTMDVSRPIDLVANETTAVEGHPGSYGAFWYSCIPVSAIEHRGLPLPVFLRIDDVEYGARQPATYMAMNGICVWHSHFVGRFRPSVDLYQYGRNMLVAAASSDICALEPFLAKFWRNFQIYVRFLAYDKASLWLDALEHYLNGPDWLACADGAQLMRDNAAKNEQMRTFDELSEEDQAVVASVRIDPAWYDEDANGERPFWWLAGEALPYDRHRFPDAMLRDDPGVVYYADTMSPWYETAMRNTLVSVDNTGERFHVRRLDRARYKQLMKRARDLRSRLKEHGDEIALEYRAAAPYLSSPDFWRLYLGL